MIKLLTVDDELDLCEYMKKFFSARGYTVLVALNGKDALSLVKQERPGVVFLDIMMPDMSGLEVLRQIKEFDPATKVIMVSAIDNDENRSLARELGAEEFIRKPFSRQYLEEVVIQKIIALSAANKEQTPSG
jgi:DNA-binding response OmpR family regulator